MRCDRCGARASVTVSKQVGDEAKALKLNLCGNHTRAHHDALNAKEWTFEVDRTVPALLPEALTPVEMPEESEIDESVTA